MSRTAAVVALTVAAVSAANLKDRQYYEQKFYDWLQTHKVQVQNGEHFLHMIQNFANNDDIIETANAENLSYQLGHNKFSHMDVNEWREEVKLGLGYPTQEPSDTLHLAPADLTTMASAIDWRNSGAVTGVKDQGQCGSCWSFSATGAMEGAYKIKSGSLVSLSEQNFVDCDNNGDHGCNGGLMDNAFAWAKTNGGVCTESAYPYTAKKGTCVTSCGTKYAKPASFTDVNKNDANALMSALNKQPVSVAIEADQSAFQLYKSGVFTATCGSNLDHGVLAVGYGTDAGKNYWTVKNSWGTSWGEAGYIRLSRDVGGKSGQCGILAGPPSYPNM